MFRVIGPENQKKFAETCSEILLKKVQIQKKKKSQQITN